MEGDGLNTSNFPEADLLRGRRALVTGATGFVGANLVRGLLERGAEVHALVRHDSDLWRIADIAPRLKLHRADIMRYGEVRRAVDDALPEYVFHLAVGRAHGSHAARVKTLRANVEGTLNLLEATAPLDYLRLVCGAGSLEYGKKFKALEEQDAPDPATFYSATKAAATILCRQFAREHGRPVVALRFFSVYGYWESPSRLIPTAIVAALKGRELALTGPGFRRDLVFVEDIVEACLLAGVRGAAEPGEIVNVGTGRQWDNEEVAALVAEVTGRPLRVRAGAYPPRATDTGHWVADRRKAERLLGWRPRHELREGLEKTVEWIRRHPREYFDATSEEASAESSFSETRPWRTA